MSRHAPILAVPSIDGWRGITLPGIDGRPERMLAGMQRVTVADRTAGRWLYLLDPAGCLEALEAVEPGRWHTVAHMRPAATP